MLFDVMAEEGEARVPAQSVCGRVQDAIFVVE